MAKVAKDESILSKDEEKAIVVLEKEVNSALEIHTDEDVEKAGIALIMAKNKFDMYEGKRKEYVQPSQESVKRINADFKKVTSRLEGYMDVLKENILTYVRIRKDDLKLAEKDLQKAAKDKSLILTNGIDRIFTQIGEIRFRKDYEFKITNKKLIPEKYWIIDEKAIQKDVDDAKGDIKIPGVKVDIVEIGGVAVYADHK